MTGQRARELSGRAISRAPGACEAKETRQAEGASPVIDNALLVPMRLGVPLQRLVQKPPAAGPQLLATAALAVLEGAQ